MIRATNIIFSYGDGPVFDQASFFVSKNTKVALVGPNGAGKSTLLKLLMGADQLSGGNFEIQGDIAYVPQEVKHDLDLENAKNIREYVDPNYASEDYEISILFSGLELTDIDLDKKPSNLSGGQKTKLALARALMGEADILLLDEPTNFMDMGGKRFVMNFLGTYSKTLLLVSHDIDLLDESVDKVLYINTQTKKIDEYSGNYTQFMALKEEKEMLAKKQHKVQSTHIKQMEEGLRTHKFSGKKGARQKTILKRRVAREKEKLPDLPLEIRSFALNLPEPPRVGEIPVRIENISKAYADKQVLTNLNLAVRRDEKLLLVGPNGSGKSTIIKILMGIIKPDKGIIFNGINLKAGYYSQEFENFDLNARVIDFFADKANIDEFYASSFLKKFMFDTNKQKQKIATLSGEKKHAFLYPY